MRDLAVRERLVIYHACGAQLGEEVQAEMLGLLVREREDGLDGSALGGSEVAVWGPEGEDLGAGVGDGVFGAGRGKAFLWLG